MSDGQLDRVASRFDGVDERLGRVATRLDGVDARLERVETGLSKLTILHEETRDDVKLIAESLVATNERMDRGFDGLRGELREVKGMMETFIGEQSEANREFRGRSSNHEERLHSLERRRRT